MKRFRETNTDSAVDNSTSVNTIYGGVAAFLNRTHLFAFPSVPQVNLGNKSTFVVVGDLLGGSSAVNGMQVHRGTMEDYNGWAKLFGGKSTWNWNGMLPYFKKVLIPKMSTCN
jgi:choline dehydrogenase